MPWASPMELKFKLTTEPAVKAVIAIGAFVGITTIITNSPNVFGINGCVLIAGLALINGTYCTPPLCARATNQLCRTQSLPSASGPRCHTGLLPASRESPPTSNSRFMRRNLPPTSWPFLALENTEKDILASSRTQFFTSNATAPHSPFRLPRHLNIRSITCCRTRVRSSSSRQPC